MKQAILVASFTLLYFWLAALPYGGVGPFLAHPARLGMIVVMSVAAVAALFSGSSGLSAGTEEDRGNRWVFLPIALLSLGTAVLPSWCDAHDRWVVGGDAVRYAGLLVCTVGLWLRLAPVFVLGHRFSGLVALQPGHTLETESVFYRWIRHPSYLGLLTTLVGWAGVFRSPLGVLLAALMLWPLHGRMDAEEEFLERHFPQYAEYRRRTWRLLPGLY